MYQEFINNFKNKVRIHYNAEGKIHNDDGPAHIINKYDGGQTEIWYKNGFRHRLYGPALQEWNAGRLLIEQAWYLEGKIHRIGGPAWTTWDPSGIKALAWYRNNERYQENGPAIQIRIENILQDIWVYHGIRCIGDINNWLDDLGYKHPLTSEQSLHLYLRWKNGS